MCYFRRNPFLGHEVREIDDAIEAWKTLTVGTTGRLVSPFQGTFWVPTNHLTANRKPVYRHNDAGIYAFKERTACRAYSGNVTVKVLLWGDILSFDALPGSGAGYGRRYAGYRARYAEIHEIHMPKSITSGTARWLAGRWEGHGVKVKHGRSVLLRGDEPMPEVAA